MALRQPSEITDLTDLISELVAANFLGVAVKTLQNQRAAGRGLPFYRIGSKVFYAKQDIINAARRGAVATEFAA